MTIKSVTKTKWYYNAKTGEVDSYREAGELTDFPRGVLMAYGDYLVTGLKSLQEAQHWAATWSACLKCRNCVSGQGGDKCRACGETLVNNFAPAAPETKE